MDRFLNNNIVLRVLAIIIACILWFTINAPAPQSTPTPTAAAVNAKDFPYAVHVDLSSNMMVTNLDKPTAVVEVTGSLPDASSLPADMIGVQVVADARGLSPGVHTVPLRAQGMPPVQYSIEPSSVTITVAQRVTVSKPVKVQVSGQPASGYQAGTPTSDVTSVQVIGESSAVNRVAAVDANISVSNAKSAVSHTITLQPVDKAGKNVPGVQVDPISVTVTVPIVPPEVSVGVSPQIYGSPAAGFAVSGVKVSPNSVKVLGTPDGTANLQQITVPLNVEGMRNSQSVSVNIPLQKGWTKITPDKVWASVKIEPSASKGFANVPVQVENAPSGFNVVFPSPTTVNIRVTGPQSVVDGLTASDITAYVDARSLQPGEPLAPVSFSTPAWVHVSQVSASEVPVMITRAGQNGSNNGAANGTVNGAGNSAGNGAANAANTASSSNGAGGSNTSGSNNTG